MWYTTQAWSLLTEGKATLQRKLLDILCACAPTLTSHTPHASLPTPAHAPRSTPSLAVGCRLDPPRLTRPACALPAGSAPQFAPHKEALLALLTQFGLAISLPSRSNDLLIPALLPAAAAASSSRPQGWPLPGRDAARLRIFFHLEGQGLEGGELLCDRSELRKGFLPIGVFHKLCAGVLGCSYRTDSGVEPALDRHNAYVAFDEVRRADRLIDCD